MAQFRKSFPANFSGFLDMFKIMPAKWDDFLTALNGLAQSVALLSEQVMSLSVTTGASDGDIAVVNSLGLIQGQLVVYRAGVFQVASATDTLVYPATHAVRKVTGTTAYLSSGWTKGWLAATSGVGSDTAGYLYLYTNGKVTDVRTDIIDSDGNFVSGFTQLQQVGSTIPSSGGGGDVPGSVYGTLSLPAPPAIAAPV